VKPGNLLRKQGAKYSIRLENIIKSINWANDFLLSNGCTSIAYLGDFFDKSELNAPEISALNEIMWPNCSLYFLCGNHEMKLHNHLFSSAKVFNMLDNIHVIDEPYTIKVDNSDILFLPYFVDSDRKPLSEYTHNQRKRIILSHNDIKGIQMGAFISQSGFEIKEIEDNCDLFINGHLHNGDKITNKIYNIGNLSGQNFGEDASRYTHNIFILDTNTLQLSKYENPHAFNFYKLDATNSPLNLSALKNNAVITIKCFDSDLDYYKEEVKKYDSIVECRFVVQATQKNVSIVNTTTINVDHLDSFEKYMLKNFENTPELIEELNEVLK